MALRIEVSEEAGVRYLHFGSSWIQGAMRIARPWSLELDYTRDMMAALLLRETSARTPARRGGARRDPSWPRAVLIIGLGAASIPKFLHRHRPRTRLRIVEIEPAVVEAARHFFKLPADDPPRFVIEIADAADYVARVRDAFDLILVDGFDASGRAGALDTSTFYAHARHALTDTGIMAVNLLGRSRGYAASVARIAAAFDDRVTRLRCQTGNVIAFAAAGERVDASFPELRDAAARLREQSGLNLLPTIARLAAARHGAGDRLVL